MCIYYEDNSGKIYCKKAGHVVYFNLEKMDWDIASCSDEKWAAEHLIPGNTDVTQITEEQAMLRLEGQILDNLDQEELHKYIELLCQNRQIGWGPEVEQSGLAFLQGDYHYPLVCTISLGSWGATTGTDSIWQAGRRIFFRRIWICGRSGRH